MDTILEFYFAGGPDGYFAAHPTAAFRYWYFRLKL